MTGSAVSAWNGGSERPGAQALKLLAAPLNCSILHALRDGPGQQADLRRQIGHPAHTTLRAQLRGLCDAGTIEKRRRNRFPGTLEYELTGAGWELLPVAEALETWLGKSPDGPQELGNRTARAAVKALAEAWKATILPRLADRALTLTELDREIAMLSYPSVERRLAAMRLVGLIEAREREDRGTPYALTEWGREGIEPIAAAARWERSRSFMPSAQMN